MPRLTELLHGLRRRLRHSERGASATIVAVLFGGGVLLGASALSMDVGSIMWERRQLQNGADAATMALAQACGRDAAACVPGTLAAQAALTDANATDHAIAFDTSVYPNGYVGAASRVCRSVPPRRGPFWTALRCRPRSRDLFRLCRSTPQRRPRPDRASCRPSSRSPSAMGAPRSRPARGPRGVPQGPTRPQCR